jgi:pyruvate dehydrogenase E1 component alpha subunit
MNLDTALLTEMYRRMFLIRVFEERAIELQRKSEIPGALHTSLNQEATVVGATMALRQDDYMTGNHRSHGHPIGKGATVDRLMAELMGKSTGVCQGRGGSMHLADFSVGSLGESGIIASAVPVALGAGISAQVRGTDQVSLTFFGDGASNAGAIHESMNMAAIWKVPMIFFCENNEWAVTTPVSKSTSVADIAQRASAYGFPGVVVDGQDPVAVFTATAEAAARARRGEGPSLIEAKTYRILEHAEGLPIPAKYREESEIDAWRQRDPLPAFARRLVTEGVLTEEEIAKLEHAVVVEVDAATEFARESEFPAADSVFDGLFSNPIVPLARLR